MGTSEHWNVHLRLIVRLIMCLSVRLSVRLRRVHNCKSRKIWKCSVIIFHAVALYIFNLYSSWA